MYKVIFRVEKLLLKLNNVECQVIAKKDSYSIPLSSNLTIKNGQVAIQMETEFFIVQNNPLFYIQVLLNCQGSKKLGGQYGLNVSEWEENVNYSTVAALKRSPDKNAQIFFQFLYIQKKEIFCEKLIILCSEYRDTQMYNVEIQGLKEQMTKKQDKLEVQIQKLKEQNKVLQKNEEDKIEEITIKKSDHQKKIQNYIENIEKNRDKKVELKKKNQQMIKMIQKFGKDDLKMQLSSKYPQKNEIKDPSGQNINEEMKQQFKEKNENGRLKKRQSSRSGGSQEDLQQRMREPRSRSRQKKRPLRKIDQQKD